MKLGLLARADSRGLGYQTLEFYKHMKPHRTLVMLLNDKVWPEDVSRYPGKSVDFTNVDPHARELDERKARKIARECDVIFAAETLMDWRLADWARQDGCRTAVQANPEFLLHRIRGDLFFPDLWIYPTPWMIDELPPGEIVPVPVPDKAPFLAPDPCGEEPLRVLHVAGHAAAGDRNGTLEFMESMRYLKRPAQITVIGQDGWLPKPSFLPSYVSLQTIPDGVADRWDLYRNQHIIVQPRKYGGNYLVAAEAARCGLSVILPDCDPNHVYPGFRMPCRKGRLHSAPGGRIQTHNCDPRAIAAIIDERERRRELVLDEQRQSRNWADHHSWSMLKPLYEKVLG